MAYAAPLKVVPTSNARTNLRSGPEYGFDNAMERDEQSFTAKDLEDSHEGDRCHNQHRVASCLPSAEYSQYFDLTRRHSIR